MQFGELLQALFKLTRQQKTDFAIAMSYSPGEISKYISGSRLPPAARLEEFISASAEYFAGSIWRQDKKDSLRIIFPIFREFDSKAQLHAFLGHALYLAYADSLQEDGRTQYGIIRNELILQGVENIYNHVVITLSNMVRIKKEIHVYMSMQFFLHYLARNNSALRDSIDGCSIHIHIMLNMTQARTILDLKGLDIMLSRWMYSSTMY